MSKVRLDIRNGEPVELFGGCRAPSHRFDNGHYFI